MTFGFRGRIYFSQLSEILLITNASWKDKHEEQRSMKTKIPQPCVDTKA